MVEDLKRQASEAYKAESEKGKLLTSESLSMKRLFYIFVAIAALSLVAIQIYGGFRPRQNSTLAALSAPPLVMEAPPPELLNPEPDQGPVPDAPPPEAAKTQPPAPDHESVTPARTPPAPEPARSRPAEQVAQAAPAPNPPATGKPVLKRDEVAATPSSSGAEPATGAPPFPQVTPEEQARREQAREIVIRSSPAMAKILTATKSQVWDAQPQRQDVYLVSFTVPGSADGAEVQYVWRVELASHSASPLNYYAKKLP